MKLDLIHLKTEKVLCAVTMQIVIINSILVIEPQSVLPIVFV